LEPEYVHQQEGQCDGVVHFGWIVSISCDVGVLEADQSDSVCIASILRIHTFSQLDWNDITCEFKRILLLWSLR
jgi:hypothetical protein